jgi:hypothetical protein
MVEVFRTDVNDSDQAVVLLDVIHKTFHDYRANFDLEDCDRILRVKCMGSIDSYHIISLLKKCGCRAEVLPDDDFPSGELLLVSDSDLSTHGN